MQLPRLTMLRFLIALCVAAGLSLVAAPSTSAHSPGKHHFVLSSHARGVSNAEVLGEAWKIVAEQPSTVSSPFPRCVLLGHGRIMYADHDAPCAVRAGVPVFITGSSTAWFNLDSSPPTSDPREQARLAIENDRAVKKLTITIDGSGPINYRTPRFELLSRQYRALMPEPNFYEVPAQEITFVVHGWGVMVKGLRPGRHHIHTQWTLDFGVPEVEHWDYVVNVLPQR